MKVDRLSVRAHSERNRSSARVNRLRANSRKQPSGPSGAASATREVPLPTKIQRQQLHRRLVSAAPALSSFITSPSTIPGDSSQTRSVGYGRAAVFQQRAILGRSLASRFPLPMQADVFVDRLPGGDKHIEGALARSSACTLRVPSIRTSAWRKVLTYSANMVSSVMTYRRCGGTW
jgi:hypothetical protein